MGMITRCPACATAFRVVADQLRVSDGWVRCGQCGEIFDAAADLHDNAVQPLDLLIEPPAAPGPLPVTDHVAEEAAGDARPPGEDVPAQALPSGDQGSQEGLTDGAAHEPPPAHPDPVDLSDAAADAALAWIESSAPEMPVSDPVGSMERVGVAELQEVPLRESAPAPAPPEEAGAAASAAEEVQPPVRAADDTAGAQANDDGPVLDGEAPDTDADTVGGHMLPESESESESESDDADAGTVLAAPGDAEASMPLPLRPAAEPLDAPERAVSLAFAPARAVAPAEPAVPEVSFIRQAPVDEPAWRRALRRALWVLAGVTLAGALSLQIVLHERDQIAASVPAARPWLQALCQAAGCRVQPLRSIESIVIDDASFSALREDGYRLQLTLRNRSERALALPAIELSLTDIQEQPVLRRVLLPPELGATTDELPARGEWAATVDVAVADNAGRARIVGYRLLPFYP